MSSQFLALHLITCLLGYLAHHFMWCRYRSWSRRLEPWLPPTPPTDGPGRRTRRPGPPETNPAFTGGLFVSTTLLLADRFPMGV